MFFRYFVIIIKFFVLYCCWCFWVFGLDFMMFRIENSRVKEEGNIKFIYLEYVKIYLNIGKFGIRSYSEFF